MENVKAAFETMLHDASKALSLDALSPDALDLDSLNLQLQPEA